MVASAFYGSLCQFCAGFTILEHGKFISVMARLVLQMFEFYIAFEN